MAQATIAKYRLSLVEWEDSATEHGWQHMDELTLTPSRIYSIGWIIEDTKSHMTLAACISKDDEIKLTTNRRLTIPQQNIIKVTDILEHLHK